MFTHEIQQIWKGGGTPISKSITKTADAEDNRDIDIPNPSTNLLVEFVVDVSQLKSLYIVSNKAITVKTNDSTTPQETISLAADQPLVWVAGGVVAIPFLGDVTAIYVTNASGAAAVLQIRSLTDSTP